MFKEDWVWRSELQAGMSGTFLSRAQKRSLKPTHRQAPSVLWPKLIKYCNQRTPRNLVSISSSPPFLGRMCVMGAIKYCRYPKLP
jgi:hypothetical protein